MDPQVASIRKFMVWAVVWALVLALMGGIFLWRAPIRAAGDALPTPISTPVQAQSPAQAAGPVQTLAPPGDPAHILYFPLMFNRGDPFLPAPGAAP